MEPIDEDTLLVRGLSLAAAVLVNVGGGAAPATIVDQARDFEAYLTAP